MTEKAIFAIREVVLHQDIPIYQTRGMGCAVEVGGFKRLLTWSGVIGEDDCIKAMETHRFSKNFFSKVDKSYRLKISTIKQNVNCSFISFDDSNDAVERTTESNILELKVPGSDVKTEDIFAHTFIGFKEKLIFKFKFNKEKKKHELDTDEWK